MCIWRNTKSNKKIRFADKIFSHLDAHVSKKICAGKIFTVLRRHDLVYIISAEKKSSQNSGVDLSFLVFRVGVGRTSGSSSP